MTYKIEQPTLLQKAMFTIENGLVLIESTTSILMEAAEVTEDEDVKDFLTTVANNFTSIRKNMDNTVNIVWETTTHDKRTHHEKQ
ncbi:MAG: hypothetical protein KME48_07125 [Candidatus Thiodiazotropha sp. (ex Ctena orbiculata)]|nr:hypothetical protein [Candidatus Thiodiazotropha taylori]MBT3034558.1 hypothetical protein [Candidatus Thiodiazotropha taylori]